MTVSSLPRFLEKLKQITETTPKKIAGWSKDGSRYEIRDKAFETSVLPKYFDAKQVLLSFSRQVSSDINQRVGWFNPPRSSTTTASRKQISSKMRRAERRGSLWNGPSRTHSSKGTRHIWYTKSSGKRERRRQILVSFKLEYLQVEESVLSWKLISSLASKSEVLEIRKELQHLSGLVNNDLKALKLQIQRL